MKLNGNRIYDKTLLNNNYYNHYNYFNRNAIKMNKLKKKDYDEYIKEKKTTMNKYHLPKMLYSNSHFGKPNYSIDNAEIKKMVFDINKEIIDTPVPYSNTRYEKDDIKDAISTTFNEKKIQTSHAGKPLMLFDDILNTVDNLEIEDRDKDEYNLNSKNEIENTSKRENSNISHTKNNLSNSNIDEDKNVLITINKNINSNNINNNYNIQKQNENPPQVKISLATNLTDDSIVQKVLEERRHYKELLKLNEYGKFKYSKEGVNYPDVIPEGKLPKYKGNDSLESQFFNYLKKASNPKKIYNDIGTFNEKFNRELVRISRSYGKEESKGRFLRNPLIERYQNTIPYYDIYKDIKFIENRYLDKGRYKYKLLPLLNTKIRNFDRLGQKIYQMNLQKRNDEFILSSIGIDKSKLAN